MDFTTHVEKSNPCTSGESIDNSNLVRPCINITLEHFIKHLQGIPIQRPCIPPETILFQDTTSQTESGISLKTWQAL